MRRTKAAQIYRKTGNLPAVQLLLGHTKLESTVRYLGIEVDLALFLRKRPIAVPPASCSQETKITAHCAVSKLSCLYCFPCVANATNVGIVESS
jgi:hypothetical protein